MAAQIENVTSVPVPAPSNGNGVAALKKAQFFPISNGHTTVVSNGHSESNRLGVLRELNYRMTSRVFGKLDVEARSILESVKVADDVFDSIAIERLRYMPRDGSQLDRVFKWTAYLIAQLDQLSKEIQPFALYSEEAAQSMWGSCLVLLSLGPDQIDLLSYVFGTFHNLAQDVSRLTAQWRSQKSVTDAQSEVVAAYSDLVELICNVSVHYYRKAHNFSRAVDVSDFHARFSHHIHSFQSHRASLIEVLWTSSSATLEFTTNPVVKVREIREFLSFHDRAVSAILSARQPRAAEYTCEWFGSHLAQQQIRRPGLTVINGGVGSGKTVLSQWIVDKLHSSPDGDDTDVVVYRIHEDISETATSINVIKGVLLQLLDRQIGDAAFLEALDQAIRIASSSTSTKDIEESLWNAALVASKSLRDVTILIDGLSELSSPSDSVPRVLSQLSRLTSHSSGVRAVVLSRPLRCSLPQGTHNFTIEPAHVLGDIKTVISTTLESIGPFNVLKPNDREEILKTIVQKSQGSFIWALMVVSSLTKLRTFPDILSAVQSTPASLSEVFNKLLATINLQDTDTRSLLAWTLASHRPFRVSEVRALFETDTKRMEPVHHIGDTTQDILSAIGTFVTVCDGVISFRYPVLRQHLITVASAVTDFTNNGGFPFHLKEAHYDIVTRCLAYVKFHVQDDLEVSSVTVSPSTQNHFFDRYELLEYTVRYWPAHFSLSPMMEGKDTFKLTATFKQCLPDSILLALLETSTQQIQFSLHTAEEFLSLSIKLRRLLFNDVSQSLLQSLVLQGRLTHILGLRTSVDYLYESWALSEKLLGSQSSVVKATAELFMQSMTKVDIKETTIIRKKETILRYLIERTKEERGVSHDLTIKYTRSLVQLYVDVKNIEAAAAVCKELYELSITRYGRFSSETQETTDIFFEQLQYFGKSEFVSEVMQTRHKYNIQHLEVTDERRITSTISSVEVFEQRGEITRAESSLFELWQSLSSVEQTSESVIKQQVDVTLKYSEFLTKHGRKDEAESIVSGMWVSLQQQSSRFESLSSTIEKFTSHIKTQKWYSLAESALSSLWSQYKSEKRTSNSSTVAVASALSEIVQESITTSRSSTSSRSSSSTTVQSHQQFGLLREVFETASQSTSVSKKSVASTIQMAETIAESYVQQGKYEKAIEIHQRAMQRIWSGIESKTSVIKLTSETTRVARQAISLAQVYFKNLQIEKASTVYENTFKSVISSVSVKDELFTSVTKDVISFYETTYQFSKVTSMYQEIYKVLSTQIGKTDERTIQALYSWGDRAIKYHQEAEAEKAYYEIFVAFGKKETLDARSIRAARALCTIYESSKRWKEAQQVYEILWKTITLHGQELSIESEDIETIYSRYSSMLETHIKADITVIHSLATSYRETCLKIYGESHVSTYKATMRLAEISHSSENEVTESSTTTTTSTTSIIKQRLAKLYSSSTETVSKAVSLYQEDYHSSVKQEGYASQTSLTALQELVTSYHKQNTKTSTTEAVKALTTATTSIFEQETDTQRMYKSSQTIAQMYKTVGHQEAAWTLLQNLRSRLIRETTSTEKTTISRKVAVFIVAFEESLFQKRTYTAIMAELVSEINLYESFYSARKEKQFLAIFISGVRLLNFQRTRNATEELQKTDTELFRLFTEYFSVKTQSSKVSIQAFYQITIAEITKREYDTHIITKTVLAIHHEIEQGHFQEAYELSSILHKFIQQVDGFSTHSNTKEGILLAKYLLGHGVKKSPDAKLVKAMSELSRVVLQDILIVYRATGVRFTDLDVSEVNEITILLGEQKNFEDLEYVLNDLWSSRIVQKTWSSDTIISIGRRLVEARFSCGRKEQAIRLCADLCYNIGRVWGQFDRITLELTALLSGLYTATGNYAAAMAVHETALRQVTHTQTDVTSAEMGAFAVQHTELLKRAYQRNGGWAKQSSLYTDLLRNINEQLKTEKTWSQSSLESVDKWQPKGADDLGLWQPPTNYGFLTVGKVNKHQNQLRKISTGKVLTMSQITA
ncbi:hypothetical protein N7499_011539 [Penicillium canescens]|uniref:Nephrocystin 3-like N-terminal domain-containing protein n=1 Tax=Penicillium canescens TaxID=5083 RepID=A0AAD6IKB9_PENCN|nr:hypothetical protein N7460_002691 [Penicillium canescens]KAJ6069652.1 hypothetical protein N7499_011539 [Penicillium canescens]